MSATELPRHQPRGRARDAAVLATFLAWLALPVPLPLHAQVPAVTEGDIARARRAQPVVTDADIEAARRRHGAPVAGVSGTVVTPGTTGLDALPQPRARAMPDLETLARGYAAQTDAQATAHGLAAGPGLIVFLSLSMPRPTLERLLDQAARARASVVLRGFAHGSLRETVTQLQALIGSREVAVQIDPPAFDRFAVTQVPSFVLVRDGARPVSCATGTCTPPEHFLKAAGDVSLDYALAHMQRAMPAFGADAAVFLARLRP